MNKKLVLMLAIVLLISFAAQAFEFDIASQLEDSTNLELGLANELQNKKQAIVSQESIPDFTSKLQDSTKPDSSLDLAERLRDNIPSEMDQFNLASRLKDETASLEDAHIDDYSLADKLKDTMRYTAKPGRKLEFTERMQRTKATQYSGKTESYNYTIKERAGMYDLDIFDTDALKKEQKISRAKIKGISELQDITVFSDKALQEKVKAGYTGKAITAPAKIKTDIFAIAENIVFENATVTLSKEGPVNTILHCPDYNTTDGTCTKWIKTDIPFTENDETITFTVNKFSGYAGAYITIINVQSYPTVGGKWIVKFNTTGTANLTIKAVQGTTWSNANETKDLKFLTIKCGSTTQNYTWTNNSVFIQNYTCSSLGYETSKVLTEGKHHLAFTFGNVTAYAHNWATASCNYRKKLTFNNSASSQNLINFTVMVKLNSSRIDYAKTSDTDIRFYDDDDTALLKHHWESWNASGTSFGWVKVPQLNNSDTDFIYAYYNCSGAATIDEKGTYDNNYVSVWHINDVGGNTPTQHDSINNYNATPQNTEASDFGVLGKIDGAESFDGIDDYLSVNSFDGLSGATQFTIEFWTKFDVPQDYMFWRNLGWLTEVRANDYRFRFNLDGNWRTSFYANHITGALHYVAATWDGTNTLIYVNNATEVNSTADSAWSAMSINSQNLGIAHRTAYFNGTIDEIRISNAARSYSWISASYLSMSDSLITYGGEEPRSEILVTLKSPQNGTKTANTTVTFNCSATAQTTELVNATLYYDHSGWHANETKNLSGSSDSATFTKTLPEGTYHWNCLVYNNESNSAWAVNNYTFTIDNTPPSVTINSPAGTIADTTPTINVTFGETVDTAWYNINHGANKTLCTSCSYVDNKYLDLAEGNYTIYVFANDTVGNLNNTEFSAFTIDMNGNYYDDYHDNSSIAELHGVEWTRGAVEFKVDTWNINWSYRKKLNVSNEDDSILKKGYSINFTLNTQALVTAGKLRADCKDLRIVWQNGSEYIELDRINETACNTTDTQIWFKLQENISVSTSDVNYYLYYGNPSAGSPPTNQSKIWHYFNDFETQVGFDAGVLNPTRNASAAKTGSYGIYGVGAANYKQSTRNNTNSGRDLIFESWVRSQGPGGGGDTSCSLASITIAHPHGGGSSGAGTSLGYQALIDERDAGSIQLRKDYDSTNRINGDNLNLNFGNWYFFRFTWTSAGHLKFEIYNSSRAYLGKVEGNDTYWASNYTDGEYGVGVYNNADWDDYRVRMYIPNKPSINLGSEEAFGGMSGNFTSTAINTTRNIIQIKNITWTENNTDAANNITVEISVDYGNTWYKVNNSQGLNGFAANNSLVYRVIFVTNGNKTISLLDMNITWIEQVNLLYCGGTYTSGNWNITTNVLCANETVPITGNVTISAGGNLTLRNATFIFQINSNGSKYIKKTAGGGLWIYDLDSDKSTTNDQSILKSSNSSYRYDFYVYGAGSNDNFTIQYSRISDAGWINGSQGIKLQNIGGTTIKANTINKSHAIYLNSSDSNLITENSITKNLYGIYTANSNNNNITNNTLQHNTDDSIYFYASTGCRIINNTIRNNLDNGVYLSAGSQNNIIQDNTLQNNTNYGAIINTGSSNNLINNNDIRYNGISGIFSYTNTRNNITNNKVYNHTFYGIIIGYNSSNTRVINNTANNNQQVGINVYSNCTNTWIENNTASFNTVYGISISINSTNATIKNNIINNNKDRGIIFINSSQGKVYDNTILNNTNWGIILDRSSNCRVNNNTVRNSAFAQIGIDLAAKNNRISNNTVSGGQRGIGIYNVGGDSSNNTIIDNTIRNAQFYGIAIESPNNTITRADINNTWAINSAGILLLTNGSDTVITDSTINNSATFGIWIYQQSNNKIEGTKIDNTGNYAIEIDAGQKNILGNSTLTGNYSNPAYFEIWLLNNARLTSINSTFNKSDPFMSDTSVLTTKWYVKGNVTDTQNNPVANATVKGHFNNTGAWALAFSTTTNANGLTPHREIIEYNQSLTGALQNWTYFTPANFTANKSTAKNYTIKTIAYSQIVNMRLDLAAEPDLIPINLSFSNNNPSENENITIYATILNNGSTAAENITIQFYDGNCTNGTQINGNITIPQLNASQNTTVNITWLATPVGPHNIHVCVDPQNAINETNETNNNLNKTLNVKAWQLYYGHIQGNLTLGKATGELEYSWNFTDNGNVYAAYLDSKFSFGNLQALGINTTGQKSANDFASADTNLNMTGFNDSVVVYFAIDNSTAKQNKTWTIYNRNIKYVPYINSTNTSNFQTGILWDTADDTDGHYSTADKEDLVFVANINNNAKGKHGTYDYELLIPRNLALYNGSADKVKFYVELK